MKTGNAPLVQAVDEKTIEGVTSAEQAFIRFLGDPNLAEQLVAASACPHLKYAQKQLRDNLPFPRLPKEVRPLIQLFQVITELSWLEVALTMICALISMVFNQVHLAQVCLLAGFALAIWLKLQALRTMSTKGDDLDCGEAVSTFLNANFSIGGMQLPVRRMWVSTVATLPCFAEGALTAIALPHAYSSSPFIATALGLVLAFSCIVQVLGTRKAIHNAKCCLFQQMCDILPRNLGDAFQSTNNTWHWVTMAAASSNLNLIAACGDKFTNLTQEREPHLPYKLQCHDEYSIAQRVVNRFILTGGPRMALKIVLFRRMGSSPVADRLNMLLALLGGLANILFFLEKLAKRVHFRLKLLKELRTWESDPSKFRSNSPPGKISIAKVFLNPFAKQFVFYRTNDRDIPFDGCVYLGLMVLMYVLWAGVQLLTPIQQLFYEVF